MTSDYFKSTSHGKLILILIGLGYFFLMLGNGIVSLTHPDEVFYVQTAKEMIAHKSWLTPLIFDAPQFEKPILFYWLLAASIKWFGITPFGARFMPAFFGILGVVVTYWISFMLFERKRAAFLAGLILMSSFIYLALSRAVLTDMVFSIWVTISIAFFYWGYRYPVHKKFGIVLCFVFSAIAILTKGLLGFTFPFLPIFIFLLHKKDFIFFKDKATLWGVLIFLAIALPWHILMVVSYGQGFIDEYFKNVHLRRIWEAEHTRCDTWSFYPLTMVGGMFPWSFFVFPSLWKAGQHLRAKEENRDQYIFLFAWIGSVLLFLQPAHSKLASYIFPVFPAMAILLAVYLDELSRKQSCELKNFSIYGYMFPLVLVGMVVASLVASVKYAEFVVTKTPVYIFDASLILLAVAMIILNYRKKRTALIFSHVGVTACVLVVLFFVKGYIEPWVSCQGIAQEFNKLDRSRGVVLSSKFYARAVRFYTDREIAVMDINGKGFFSPHPVPFLNADHKVQEFLTAQPLTYAIVKKGDVEDLRRILHGDPSFVIEELKEIGGKYIVKIEKRN